MKNIEDVQNDIIVDAVAKDIRKSMRADELDKRKSGEAIRRDVERAAK
ncbi:MAG: hypothetical protein WC389_10945 [Lutibacter sp.]|jgi:hypothetical protein